MANQQLTNLPTTGRGGKFTVPHTPPFPENTEVTLECGPGYRLPPVFHSKVVLIGGVLQWDPNPIDCLPLSELWPLPQSNSYGKFSSLQTPPFHVGDTATLTCDLGYFIPSHRSVATVMVKNDQLVWEPESMDCQPVQCGQPFIPTFGTTSHKEFHFPRSFHYVCYDGYQFNQSLNEFYCGVGGQWTPPIQGVDCEPIQCPELKPPVNGSVYLPNRFYNSVATFQCDPGLEMVQGEETRVCQSDGQWSGLEVKCGKIPCPQIDSRANVSHFGTPITIIDCGQGQTVSIICKKGQWSKSYPYCPNKPALIPPAPAVTAPAPAVKRAAPAPAVKRAAPATKPPVASPVVSSYMSLGWFLFVIGLCFIFLSWCIRKNLE